MLLFIEGYPYTLNHKVKTNLKVSRIYLKELYLFLKWKRYNPLTM